MSTVEDAAELAELLNLARRTSWEAGRNAAVEWHQRQAREADLQVERYNAVGNEDGAKMWRERSMDHDFFAVALAELQPEAGSPCSYIPSARDDK